VRKLLLKENQRCGDYACRYRSRDGNDADTDAIRIFLVGYPHFLLDTNSDSNTNAKRIVRIRIWISTRFSKVLFL
jgi:hypothetical protein